MTASYVFGALASVSFALASVLFQKYSAQVSTLWMNTFKALVALFGFGVLSLCVGGFESLPRISTLMAFFVSGMIGLAGADMFLFKSFTTIGAARTLIVFSFQPLFIAAAGYIFFGQIIGTHQLIAIVCLMGCVLILSYEKFRAHGTWEIMGLLGALIAVMLDSSGVMLTRYAFDQSPALSVFEGNFYRCLGALAIFAIMSRYKPIDLVERFVKLKLNDKCLVIYVSFLGTILALYFWLTAIKQGHLASVVALGGTGPLFAMLFECIYKRTWPSRMLLLALGSFAIGFYFLMFGKTLF